MAGDERPIADLQLGTVAVLAFSAGLAVGSALESPTGGWLLGSVAATAVVVARGGRLAGELSAHGRGKIITAGEIVALGAVVIGLHLLTAGERGELVAAWLTAAVTYLLAQTTLDDLAALVLPLDTGREITTPVQRLGRRFLRVGLVVAIGVALSRRGLVALAGYWLLGFGALGLAERLRSQERWRRDRSLVDGEVSRRWSAGLAATLVAVVVLVLALAPFTGQAATLANTLLVRAFHAADRLLRGLVGVEGRGPALAEPRTVSAGPQEGVTPIDLDLPPLADLFLLLGFALLFSFAWMILVGVRRRVARGDGSWVLSVLLSLPRLLWRLLIALLRLLKDAGRVGISMVMRRLGHPEPSAATGWRWSPDDPIRRVIAREYRAFQSAAGRRWGERRGWETPAEFGRRVEGELGEEPAVASLTTLFVEARYSRHEMGEGAAEAAGRHRKLIDRRLEEG
jgi:hypothetical protein